MREDALRKAAKIAGSKVKLAKQLAISVKTLNNWVNAGIRIPLEHAMKIEVSVDGQVIAEHISPHTSHSLQEYKKFLGVKWWKDFMKKFQKIKHEGLKNKKLILAEKKTGLPLRLIFLGLLACCDINWHFCWQPNQLKMDILPDEENVDFEAALNLLFSTGLINKCEFCGKCYGTFSCLQTRKTHQLIDEIFEGG